MSSLLVRLDGNPRRKVILEYLEDPLVLVCPRRRADESVVLHRVDCQLPVFLTELDETLCKSHDVLEENVRVHHPMENHEWIGETFRKINRRRSAIGDRITLR